MVGASQSRSFIASSQVNRPCARVFCGRFVRDGDNALKVLLRAGADKVASIRRVAPDLPAELVELVDAALLFDARVRWPTAKAMRSAVRMVSAKLKHQRADVARGDGEDAEDVPSDLSGPLAVRSITPPPPSSIAGDSEPFGIAPLALPWVGDEGPRAETLDEQGVGSVRTATSPPSDAAGTSAPTTGSTSATTSGSPALVETVPAKREPLVPSAVGATRLSIAWTAVIVALLVVAGFIALALVRR